MIADGPIYSITSKITTTQIRNEIICENLRNLRMKRCDWVICLLLRRIYIDRVQVEALLRW